MPHPIPPCRTLVITLALACGFAQAAPGDLDPGFGTGGFVLDPMNGNDAQARALAIDATGRVVVAGPVANNVIDDDFGVLRLDAGGSADPGFGSGGRAYASYSANSDDEGYGVAVLADGRIVVGGLTFISDGSGDYPDFAAVRFDAAGGIDTSYGNHGNGWMTSGRAGGDYGIAMAAGAAGVVLSGYVDDGGGGIDAAALRLDTLGMPLPLFGDAGVLVAEPDTNSSFAVALSPDGSVVLGGHLEGSGAFVQRADATGAADPAFAGDGRAEIGALLDRVEDLLLLADGRVVVAGYVGVEAAIVRLTSAGIPDASFGSGGRYTLAPAAVGATSVRATALAIQPDGSIVAAGIANAAGEVSVLALRVDANGSVDAGFGDGGARVYELAGNQWATAVALQADGAIVLAGYDEAAGGSGGSDRFLIARIEGGGGGPGPRVVSIADANLVEGDAGSALMGFTLSLSTPSDGSVAIDVATDLGTATPNVDYVPTTATLVFPNGATALAFQVPVNGDTDVEADETFLVQLSNPVNATLGDAQAAGTIVDDDDEPPPQGAVQPVPTLGALALVLLGLLVATGALFARRRA